MAEQTEERLQRAMDVIVRIQRIDNPKTIKAFEPFLRKDAALLLEAIDGPVPDWADLREMARNAGWTRRTMAAGLRPVTTDVWGKYPPGDKFAEVVQEGAVRIGLAAHGLFIELHGPGKDQRERADLINPTPAKVLTIARELGIGGTS